jgi:hypothetical protein
MNEEKKEQEIRIKKINLNQYTLPRFGNSYIIKVVVYVVLLVILLFFLKNKLDQMKQKTNSIVKDIRVKIILDSICK